MTTITLTHGTRPHRVYDAIKASGSHGMTTQDLAAGMPGLPRKDVGSTVYNLVRQGAVVATGRRRPDGYHSLSKVYVATTAKVVMRRLETGSASWQPASPWRGALPVQDTLSPLPEGDCPAPVQSAIRALRRDGFPVVPVGRDGWLVGTVTVGTGELLERAERARLRRMAA